MKCFLEIKRYFSRLNSVACRESTRQGGTQWKGITKWGGTNLVGRLTRQEQGHIKIAKIHGQCFLSLSTTRFHQLLYSSHVTKAFSLKIKHQGLFCQRLLIATLYRKPLANMSWKENVFLGDTNKWAIIFFQENILKYEWNDNVPHKSLST